MQCIPCQTFLKFILIMMAHSSLQGFNNVHVKNNSLCRVGKAISKSKSGFLLSRFFFITFYRFHCSMFLVPFKNVFNIPTIFVVNVLMYKNRILLKSLFVQQPKPSPRCFLMNQTKI